jgi:hypothetical protein
MATYRIQHCLQGATGSGRDKYCNTFYYTGVIPPDSSVVGGGVHGDLIAQDVRDFYNTIQDYLASYASGPFRSIKIYDVAASPGSPAAYSVTDSSDAFTPDTTATNLPEEVAVCMSYSAVSTGANPARRRGRVYLGPLNTNVCTSGAVQPLVPAGFQELIVGAANDFAAALTGHDVTWSVHSTVDDAAFTIVQVSVDNAFDTMRKRGRDATGSALLTL